MTLRPSTFLAVAGTLAFLALKAGPPLWHVAHGMRLFSHAVAAPSAAPAPEVAPASSLKAARKAHATQLTARVSDNSSVPVPPADELQRVSYVSPAGRLAAYLSPPPKDGTRHPAIVWIAGGNSNTLDEGLWAPADPSNDQTARAFREAGVVTLYPSLRGGNDNPGVHEGFYGELDDILAAADFLAARPEVDPARIYLGGHSTGGTMALLAAEYDGRFRAAFAFGPVGDVRAYGGEFAPIDLEDEAEVALRSPLRWLSSIRSPVFLFEGSGRGNVAALRQLEAASTNPLVHVFTIHGADHFSTLSPTTALIARKILADTAPEPNIAFTAEELDAPFGK